MWRMTCTMKYVQKVYVENRKLDIVIGKFLVCMRSVEARTQLFYVFVWSVRYLRGVILENFSIKSKDFEVDVRRLLVLFSCAFVLKCPGLAFFTVSVAFALLLLSLWLLSVLVLFASCRFSKNKNLVDGYSICNRISRNS